MNSFGTKYELPLWKFALDLFDQGERLGFHLPEYDDSELTEVPAGKAWDQYDLALHHVSAVGWYRLKVNLTKNDAVRHFLDFDGVGGLFDIWVNGQKAAESLQRYLPAQVDIENLLVDGENTFAIRVDNRHKGIHHLTGGQVIEWILYGGLIHKVYLNVLPTVRISHIFAKTEYTGEANIAVEVTNNSTEDFCGAVSIDLAGEKVSADVCCKAGAVAVINLALKASDITPWCPDTPALYDLNAVLTAKCGTVVSTKVERIGFRTIECCGTKLLLNGEELFIKGANRYDEYDPYGPSVPEDKIREDLLMMKKCGMNFVRTHYEQDPATYRIADEIGIMYMLEVPLNWWNPANDDEETQPAHPGPTKSEDNWESLKEIATVNLDTTFRFFCNHPSWVVWSTSNECLYMRKPGEEMFRYLAARMRSYNPGRLVTTVVCHMPEDSNILDYCDFIGYNAYPGMLCAFDERALTREEFPTKVYDATVKLMSYIRDLYPDRPIVMTEFGGRSIYGLNGNYYESEDHHAEYIECVCKAFLSIEEIRGLVLWCWADYYHHWSMAEPYGPYGIVTVDRKIKEKPFKAMSDVFHSIK